MADGPMARYRALITAANIEPDAAQEAAAQRLDRLAQNLERFRPNGGVLARLAGNSSEPPRGVYLHGGVGRGKSMLMDLFFEAVDFRPKRRVHFHAFMAEIHDRMVPLRQRDSGDPVLLVGEAIGQETKLLCFDELHVLDIADAMILSRLFKALFAAGVVVVATSNAAPDELYKGGLNRALFLPFIALMERHMEVAELAARADFRLEKLAGQPVWHVPAGVAAAAALDDAWRRLTGGQPGAAQDLRVLGRTLRIPRAARGVARFGFDELCEQPLGAPDYLKIAHEFHTLIIDRIPVMDYEARNEAKRFIILIDTFYDNAVKLLASAAVEPDMLYLAREGFEAREFKRTASRLIEMRSQSYLALPHGRRDSAASPSTQGGIVET